MFLKQIFKILTTCLFTIALFLTSLRTDAFASACCAGSGSQSIFLLSRGQRYLFGLTTVYSNTLGHFDPYGAYTKKSLGTSSSSIISTLGSTYRIRKDLQAGLSLPFIHNEQTISNKSSSDTAFGDPSIEARYTLLEDLAFLKYRPELSFYLGAKIPFGKSIYDSKDPNGADITGDGMTTFHVGLNTTKLYQPFKFSFDSAFFYPMKKNVTEMKGEAISPYSLKAGNRIQLSESVTYLLNDHWSGGLNFRQLWIFKSSINGKPVEASAGRLFTTGVAINYFHNASLGISLAYNTAFPFYRYLANEPNEHLVSLSAVYGIF